MSRVQRGAPVSVNLLCGGKHGGGHIAASVIPPARAMETDESASSPSLGQLQRSRLRMALAGMRKAKALA